MEFQSNENKPNTGALFKNKDKVEGDSKPNYSGPFVNERGDEARIAVWLRTSKAGQPYMYAQVSEKYDPTQQQQQQQQQSQAPTPPPMPAEMAQASAEDEFFGDNGSF